MTSRIKAWLVGCLVGAVGLGLAGGALDPAQVRAQLRDPPLGWDMWDPSAPQRDVWESERLDRSLRWRLTRHETFMREGVPPTYRDARNPLATTPETMDPGRALYAERCAACHDPAGTGHGDAGLALHPSPALLAHLIRMPRAADAYLLWSIAEGGAPFGTSMPAFKDSLSREQIWQIITFMRAGFPSASN